MNTSNFEDRNAMAEAEIAAALRAMPPQSAPEGGWKRVLDRFEAGQHAQIQRRRYWRGGLAVAASIAVAVAGLRLGAGMFFGAPAPGGDIEAELQSAFPENATAAGEMNAVALGDSLAQMDLDALIALSRFQEERLRALPVGGASVPGRVVRLDTFGLATELEDTIAMLDEGFTQVSLSQDQKPPARTLLEQRAVLMDDLWTLRRAEALRAGFIYASL